MHTKTQVPLARLNASPCAMASHTASHIGYIIITLHWAWYVFIDFEMFLMVLDIDYEYLRNLQVDCRPYVITASEMNIWIYAKNTKHLASLKLFFLKSG